MTSAICQYMLSSIRNESENIPVFQYGDESKHVNSHHKRTTVSINRKHVFWLDPLGQVKNQKHMQFLHLGSTISQCFIITGFGIRTLNNTSTHRKNLK